MDNAQALENLVAVVEKLTAPDGCSWDREQTPETLADYVIEESHELVAAIRFGNQAEVMGELGDLAFLVLFIAHLYEKNGAFTLARTLENNRQKMIRRHPHVFGDTRFENRDDQLAAWEAIKRSEHSENNDKPGIFTSLPKSLPPLIRAYRLHSKAARVGFTWATDEEVEQQVEAEWLEFLDASLSKDEKAEKHEIGDMFFSLVELARRKGIKANEALDLACERFLQRFERMEEIAREKKLDFPALSLDEKDELWNQAKSEQAGNTEDK